MAHVFATPWLILGLFGFWKKNAYGGDDTEDVEPKPYPLLDLTPLKRVHSTITSYTTAMSFYFHTGLRGFIKMEKDKAADEMYITKIKHLEGERPTYEYTLLMIYLRVEILWPSLNSNTILRYPPKGKVTDKTRNHRPPTVRWSIPLLVQIMEDLDLVSGHHTTDCIVFLLSILAFCHHYDADDGADYCIGIPGITHIRKGQAGKTRPEGVLQFLKTTTLQPIRISSKTIHSIFEKCTLMQ